ncbi:19822_t:CDS:2 [Entrophospora sp. SA101]|nr:19822_t:CDS:2 [Entrophospora sp. SA101]
MYTQELEYTKETITAKQLSKLSNHWRKPKVYNPKTNRMIAIDGPTYNKMIRDGYVHWEEEGLLIPPSPFENYISGASTDTKCHYSIIASSPKDLEEEIIREIAKRILQNRYGFSVNQ